MSSIGSPSPFFLAGKKAYQVERSLRFNDDDTAYLERNVTSSSNRKTHTFSAWIKRCEFGDYHLIFTQGDNTGGKQFWMFFDNDDRIEMQDYDNTTDQGKLTTTQKFRDPSAWYHIVMRVDTTNSTADDRFRIYVNGEQITSFDNRTNPSQNLDTWINDTTYNFRIGLAGTNGMKMDGYMAEINFVDGLSLDPSSFGETDAITGQWNPKKYVGSYGTNGFYLNFSENSGTTATTLGKDSSGNGNNFTPNNFSVSAGAGNDSLEDTPTNNFPTFNPLVQNVNTFSEGNLQVTMTSNAPPSFYSTMGVSSGKYYMEFLVKSNNNYPLGISGSTQSSNYFSLGDQIAFWLESTNTRVFRNGNNVTGSSEVVGNFETGVEGTSTSWAVDDIAGLALDMDNKIIYLYKGSTQVGYVNFSTFNYDTVFFGGGNYINGNVYIGNFGQRPFAHTPPTGYKKLNSANLPDPTILLPNKHFDTLLYTGDGSSSHTITGLNFKPDWVWLKSRSAAHNHGLMDAVRGRAGVLFSNSTSDEKTSGASQDLVSFNSNGITVGTPYHLSASNNNGTTIVGWNWNAGDTDSKTYVVKVVSDSGNKYRFDNFGTSAVTLDLAEGGTYIFNMDDSSNASHPFSIGTAANGTVYTSGITYFLDGVSKTYSEYTSGFAAATTRRLHITVPASAPVLYYWCSVHSGMGGQINTNSSLGSSNFDGSIQSTAKVNATAGFSIVTYTSPNNSSDQTVGHGLGVKPSFIIVKNRDDTYNYDIYHSSLGYNASLIFTNATTRSGAFGAEPTSTVYTSKNNYTHASTNKYVAYVFSEVAGYSKFGSYTGNGSTDGVFVFTGFRPAFIIIKSSSLETNWNIATADIDGYNVVTKYLDANTSNAEGTYTFLDILSNGFKARNVGNSFNQSGASYIYLCFAEAPFKNARAR